MNVVRLYYRILLYYYESMDHDSVIDTTKWYKFIEKLITITMYNNNFYLDPEEDVFKEDLLLLDLRGIMSGGNWIGVPSTLKVRKSCRATPDISKKNTTKYFNIIKIKIKNGVHIF